MTRREDRITPREHLEHVLSIAAGVAADRPLAQADAREAVAMYAREIAFHCYERLGWVAGHDGGWERPA